MKIEIKADGMTVLEGDLLELLPLPAVCSESGTRLVIMARDKDRKLLADYITVQKKK